MLTLATICSGIGAPEVACHSLGWRSIWASQFDPEHDYARGPDFPSAVLAHRFPGLRNHGDFTQLIGTPPASPDVLIGGTPCQAFSVAGLRGGLADPRGGLTLAFVTLVGVLRPRWVVWENVPGVLSADGGTAFGSLLSGLGVLGYGWSYRVLDAQYFGLGQRRKRVFVVAHSGGNWRRAAAVLFEPEGVRWDSPPRREAGEGVAGAIGAGADGRGWRCGADEVAAGQAVATWPAEVAPTINAAYSSKWGLDNQHIDSNGGGLFVPDVAHTLRGNGHDASEDGTGRGVPLIPIAGPLSASNSRRNNGPSGRGGDPFVQEVADPLTASAAKRGGASGGKDSQPRNHIAHNGGVRRLTPREMERLQGFDDDFTLIPTRQSAHVEDDYFRWLAINQPDLTMADARKLAKDGPRAKALGNSMAVPVVRWLCRRIEMVDAL